MNVSNRLRTQGWFWSIALIWVAAAYGREPLSVRVATTPGGPQIHVNGTPVPPRFFWGSENSGNIRADADWSTCQFDLTPERDAPGNATLHFRFADTPGEVWIKELRFIDTVTGADVLPSGSFASEAAFQQCWSVWPQGAENTVGTLAFTDNALHVTLRAPAAGTARPDFHLYSRHLTFSKARTYRCSFAVKAAPAQSVLPCVYRVDNGHYSRIGGPPGSFYTQIALARDAGVNLVSFSAPACWAPPEKTQDWSPLDALCRRIIAVNPNVLLVPRVSANAPDWWLKHHPDARMVYDGQTPYPISCVSHRAYRAAVCAHLEKLTQHLREAFPGHFAGVHPCGQNTGEWFYYDSWEPPLSGYDPATRDAFRAWLAARGVPDAATAEPPEHQARRAHPYGLLRDPAHERRLIDFALFQQEEMANHVLALAAACRRGSGGQALTLFFYGYGFEFGPLGNGAPTSGHYALEKVLRCGAADIDILCSPISYTDRRWLGTAPVMSAAESVTRSGILWLNEDDSRTYLDPRKQEHVQEGGLVNLQQTQQVMLRNTAQAALRGFGTWWMDLPGQGWFNDAAIWREMVRLRPVDEAMCRRPQPFTPEIAAIIDETSMCHLTGGSATAAQPLIYEGRAALGRCGAPYGQYLLADALAGKVSARLLFYLSAWHLDDAQRKTFAAQRRDAGATVRVWCWAPGYLRPDRADLGGIADVTGFKARPADVETAQATPTARGRQHGLTQAWGPVAKVRPLFTVEAADDEVWATYTDGSPAVAIRRAAQGHDVFVGVPQLTPELVHALARLAGVHCYTAPGPALWAANGHLSIQAHTDGAVRIDTGRQNRVTDALDGTELGNGPVITLHMQPGEVRVLHD